MKDILNLFFLEFLSKNKYYEPLKINKTSKVLQGAIVTGDVEIGKYCGIWFNSVIRGDSCKIKIGNCTNVQDCCILHGDENFDLNIGNGVSVGHGAILHGCTIGDNTVIGMGAILLNGAKVGKNCIIGAGSVVSGKTVVPDNHLAIGSPCVIKRELKDNEVFENKNNAKHYCEKIKF
ncbi:MAG: gamma carbonic anhydrase family protein [Oscillospiraceae bacterium]